MLALGITVAVLTGLVAFSSVKINSSMLHSIESANVALQAQQYAAARADKLRGLSYKDLKELPKTSIKDSNGYFEEVTLGPETPSSENPDVMHRDLLVNVYKDNNSISSASLRIPVFSDNSGESGNFVVNEANDNSVNTEYDENGYPFTRIERIGINLDGYGGVYLNGYRRKENNLGFERDYIYGLLSNVARHLPQGLSLNDITDTGVYQLWESINGHDPGYPMLKKGDGYDFLDRYVIVQSFGYFGTDKAKPVLQKATGMYNKRVAIRNRINGIWSEWKLKSTKNLMFFGGNLSVDSSKIVQIPLPREAEEVGLGREDCVYIIWPEYDCESVSLIDPINGYVDVILKPQKERDELLGPQVGYLIIAGKGYRTFHDVTGFHSYDWPEHE